MLRIASAPPHDNPKTTPVELGLAEHTIPGLLRTIAASSVNQPQASSDASVTLTKFLSSNLWFYS